MLCVPVARALVAQTAVRAFPLPANATAPQPLIDAPPSRKLTEPVGLLPVTVAVRVIADPAVDGLAELASVVVVALLPPVVTLTVSALDVAPVTMMFTP
jgi:hypothetical protein